MKGKFLKFIIISIALGIAVALAAHYYINQHPESKDTVVMAYMLGMSVTIFSFLFQVKTYGARLTQNRSLDRIAADIQQEPAYYDHDFYFNHLKKGFNLFIFFLVGAGGVYFLLLGRFIMAGILILPSSMLIYFSLKEFNDRSPQVRIAANGIWLKDFGFTPWEKIQRIHIRKDRSGRSETAKLEIFLMNSESKGPDQWTEINEMKQWKDMGGILQSMEKTEVENDY